MSKPFTLLLLVLFAFRSFFARFPNITPDEAHYYLYGQWLDWSYFDHPPLVGWTQWLFSWLPQSEWSARLPAILLGLISTYFLYEFIKTLKPTLSPLLIVVITQSSFLINTLLLSLFPDTLLMVLIFPLMHLLYRLKPESKFYDYLLFGLVLGLCGLSKYTAILLIPGIALYFILQKNWKMILNFKWLYAIGMALLTISPVLYWNFLNDWASLKYQSHHVMAGGPNLTSFLQSLAGQIISYTLPLYFFAAYGFYKSAKSYAPIPKMIFSFSLPIFLFFLYSSFRGPILPHWSILFYLLTIPYGLIEFLRPLKPRRLKIVYASAAFSFLFLSVLLIEMSFKLIPQPDYNSVHRDIVGWPKVMAEVDQIIQNSDNTVAAVTNWSLGSRALFYSKYREKIYVLDDHINQFDFWQPQEPKGLNVLFVNTHFFKKDIKSFYKCDMVENVDSIEVKIQDNLVNNFDLIWCLNYQGLNEDT